MKRKTISRVLMCRPTYYTVEHVYNSWMMPGTVDTKLAIKQWEFLVNVYKQLGIRVEVIDQVKGIHDMVFATDQGIVQGRKVLLSRFRPVERRPETRCYEQWFF